MSKTQSTDQAKQKQRNKIAEDIAKFLKAGGEIKQLEDPSQKAEHSEQD
jgi:hypothetical protein